MIINYFRGLFSGKSPQEAHTNAVNGEIKRVNPLNTQYKIGDTITNPAGISGEVVGFNENGSPIIRRK